MVYGCWVLIVFMVATTTNHAFGLETTNIEIYKSQIKNLVALAIQSANGPT